MQTLEALRRQIASVEDMRSIVTTMKTLAAVSIRQYESAVEALSHYDDTIQMAFRILLRDQDLKRTAETDRERGVGVIVFGSDQGMCGQFNDQIAEFAVSRLATAETASTLLLAVGVRVHSRLEEAGYAVERGFDVPVSVTSITRLVEELLPQIQQWQADRKTGRLIVFYNAKTSAASYRPRQIQLLPIPPQQLAAWQREPWRSRSLPQYSMPRRELFAAVIRQYLFVSLFRACAESLASENASRIASMQAAEKNIEERLADLQAEFHHQRQTSITEELLDVVTGFEALAQQRRARRSRGTS